MRLPYVGAVACTVLMSLAAWAQETATQTPRSEPPLKAPFSWVASPAYVGPERGRADECVSVKDPSVVYFDGSWHLFCTIRSRQRTHQIEYLAFADWKEANGGKREVLKMHPGYFCAPQVFYFTPQKKWYLICQASDDTWSPKYRAAFSTGEDVGNPAGWTKLAPMFEKPPEKAGLDFWVICDETHAYFFYTTLDGRMWRSATEIGKFPHGWSEPVVCLQGDIFEASHTYKLKGRKEYLTIVEAQDGGRRYYKAYLADRLDGEWRALADTKENPFASVRNVRQPGVKWTDSISHGELVRVGVDEKMEIDPENLRFVFQGVSDEAKAGKPYGEIPWRLGILEQVK